MMMQVTMAVKCQGSKCEEICTNAKPGTSATKDMIDNAEDEDLEIDADSVRTLKTAVCEASTPSSDTSAATKATASIALLLAAAFAALL